MNKVEINSIRHDVYTLWYHSEIIEEKQGPYCGEKDKERFDSKESFLN